MCIVSESIIHVHNSGKNVLFKQQKNIVLSIYYFMKLQGSKSLLLLQVHGYCILSGEKNKNSTSFIFDHPF